MAAAALDRSAAELAEPEDVAPEDVKRALPWELVLVDSQLILPSGYLTWYSNSIPIVMVSNSNGNIALDTILNRNVSHWINGHFRILNWRYLPYIRIYKAYHI